MRKRRRGRRISPPPLGRSLGWGTLPVLRDADAEQARIGDEDIRRQRAVVGVQERPGDDRCVERTKASADALAFIVDGQSQAQTPDDRIYEPYEFERMTGLA